MNNQMTKFDEDLQSMIDFYEEQYGRMVNKLDDNHPYLCRLKKRIKELKKERRKFK